MKIESECCRAGEQAKLICTATSIKRSLRISVHVTWGRHETQVTSCVYSQVYLVRFLSVISDIAFFIMEAKLKITVQRHGILAFALVCKCIDVDFRLSARSLSQSLSITAQKKRKPLFGWRSIVLITKFCFS
jgi:hypothetical protein